MAEDNSHTIVDWLTERGCSDHEIQKIMVRLDEYDDKIIRESIFSGDSDSDTSWLEDIMQEVRNAVE